MMVQHIIFLFRMSSEHVCRLWCPNILPVFRCCSTLVFTCYKYFDRKSHAPLLEYHRRVFIVTTNGVLFERPIGGYFYF
ncbi:hypothetical protein MKX03_031732 [Papaver bracteatum]|nr:hypothetical protein MKX03_031732 [Papaver bracteatum]